MKETDHYQKAVKIENPCAVTMTPIEAAAQTDCPTLNRSPLTVPGPPINSFIFSPSEGRLYFFFFSSSAKQGPGISAMKTKRALPLAMSSDNRLPSLESLLRTHHQLDWASGEEEVEDLRRSSDGIQQLRFLHLTLLPRRITIPPNHWLKNQPYEIYS